MKNNNIGDARRAYAESIGNKFTQEDAAKYFDVSIGTYRNWEQGRVDLSSAQISQIADLYGTTTDYLLGTSPKHNAHYTEVLTKDEKRLVQLYRESSDFGRKRLVQMAEAISCAFSAEEQEEA